MDLWRTYNLYCTIFSYSAYGMGILPVNLLNPTYFKILDYNLICSLVGGVEFTLSVLKFSSRSTVLWNPKYEKNIVTSLFPKKSDLTKISTEIWLPITIIWSNYVTIYTEGYYGTIFSLSFFVTWCETED